MDNCEHDWKVISKIMGIEWCQTCGTLKTIPARLDPFLPGSGDEPMIESPSAESDGYIISPPYCQGRVEHAVYERAEAQTVKWEPIEAPIGLGTCGNISPEYDKTTGKCVLRPERHERDPERFEYMFHVISSAMLLYRLLCLFKADVETEGPEGYKCIWWVNLKHKETGEILRFGEWKGAAGIWTRFHRNDELPEAYKRDMLLLLDELVAEDCPHPYDGNIAGSVA
jgi:hypothetical protein